MPGTFSQARTQDEFDEWCDTLVDDFGSWADSRPDLPDPGQLRLLLTWKHEREPGNVGAWSAHDLDAFLLTWAPRNLLASDPLAFDLPTATAEAIVFLAERGLLTGDEPAAALVDHARDLHVAFLQAMDGHGYGEPEPVPAAAPSAPVPDPVVGPVFVPRADHIVTSAREAPLLAGFAVLVDFFAEPGRPLDTDGRLTADGEELAERLSAVTDASPRAGDVAHWLWWGQQVGLLRRDDAQLTTTGRSGRMLSQDPVPVVWLAADVLLDHVVPEQYGPAGSAAVTLVHQAQTRLLTRLLADHGSTWDDAVADVGRLMAAGAADGAPADAAGLLAEMVHHLQRAGLLTQEHAADGGDGGDRLRLTPIGTMVAMERARRSGVRLVTASSVNVVTAAELVRLSPSVEVTSWWAAVGEWLDFRGRPERPVRELVTAFIGVGLADLVLAVANLPAGEVDRVRPVLEALAAEHPKPSDQVGAVLRAGLRIRQRGPQADPTVSLDDTAIAAMGALVEEDAPLILSWLSPLLKGPRRYVTLAEIAASPMPHADKLLAMIARQHRDPAVAEAARKGLTKQAAPSRGRRPRESVR